MGLLDLLKEQLLVISFSIGLLSTTWLFRSILSKMVATHSVHRARL